MKNMILANPFRWADPRTWPWMFYVWLAYSYSAAGNTATGTYKRDFDTDEEALEFQEDLKGKPVAVHYNPNKPSNSALSEASVELLLQTRPPRTSTDYPLSVQKSSLPPLAAC